MKAIQFQQHGGPEVLRYTDVPDPEPRAIRLGRQFTDARELRSIPHLRAQAAELQGAVRASRSLQGR